MIIGIARNPQEIFMIPNSTEFTNSLLAKPPCGWFPQQYHQSMSNNQISIRWLGLGGSNTGASYKNTYPRYLELLDEYIKDNYHTSSYVINRGIPGGDPEMALDIVYDILMGNTSLWPNIISLEFSVNCYPNTCPKFIDRLISFFNNIYARSNVSSPSFIYIDLFMTNKICDVHIPLISPDERFNYIENLIKSNMITAFDRRGDQDNSMLTLHEVVNYYYIPILSFTNMKFNEFKNYFIQHNTSNCRKWEYSRSDGHVGKLGHEYILNNMIIPFLDDHLLNRSVCNGSIKIPRVRYYENDTFSWSQSFEVWSDWGLGSFNKPLKDIIVFPLKGWERTFPVSGHPLSNRIHICYGSNITKSHIEFDISGLLPCSKRDCLLVIYSLGSSSMKLGRMNCTLHDAHNRALVSYIINGTSNLGTTPKSTHIGIISNDSFRLKCTKLDSLFSYVTHLLVKLKD